MQSGCRLLFAGVLFQCPQGQSWTSVTNECVTGSGGLAGNPPNIGVSRYITATLQGPLGSSASVDMCYCTLGPPGTPAATETPYYCSQSHAGPILGSVGGYWNVFDPTCCANYGRTLCNDNTMCCPQGQICCNNVCVAGAICCGDSACPAGTSCCGNSQAGYTCCGSGELCCNNNCVDSNVLHCGACNNVCGDGQTCQNGACVCQASYAPCADNLCCAPGTVCCSNSAGKICLASGPEWSCCNNQVVGVLSDPNNCGRCGNVCGSNQKCVSGACETCGNCEACDITSGACGLACPDPCLTATLGGVRGWSERRLRKEISQYLTAQGFTQGANQTYVLLQSGSVVVSILSTPFSAKSGGQVASVVYGPDNQPTVYATVAPQSGAPPQYAIVVDANGSLTVLFPSSPGLANAASATGAAPKVIRATQTECNVGCNVLCGLGLGAVCYGLTSLICAGLTGPGLLACELTIGVETCGTLDATACALGCAAYCSCGAGQQQCGDVCCPLGQACVNASTSTCGAPCTGCQYRNSAGTCVDPCPPCFPCNDNTGQCVAVTCGNAGEICCNRACVNPQTDAVNCGACNQPCNAGEICCDGVCVDPQADSAHCGSCTQACNAEQVCSNGTCVCAGPEYVACGPDHCMPSGSDCCNEAAGYSCDAGQCCGGAGQCCDASLCCSGTCCDESEKCCGGNCCDPASCCGDNDTFCCTWGQKCCCGSHCCDTNLCCNGTCCGGGQTCCGGQCCDPADCCGNTCCTVGVCVSELGNVCCDCDSISCACDGTDLDACCDYCCT